MAGGNQTEQRHQSFFFTKALYSPRCHFRELAKKKKKRKKSPLKVRVKYRDNIFIVLYQRKQLTQSTSMRHIFSMRHLPNFKNGQINRYLDHPSV
jgi:hypothetical protein